MERGLLWLPLLAIFIGLAWAGWNEYQKLEWYQDWAKEFERSKYDILAILGQQGDRLTWGKPTRSGLVNQQTLALQDVQGIQLLVNSQVVSLDDPPQGKRIALQLELKGKAETVEIPFTDAQLAREWGNYLQKAWLIEGEST